MWLPKEGIKDAKRILSKTWRSLAAEKIIRSSTYKKEINKICCVIKYFLELSVGRLKQIDVEMVLWNRRHATPNFVLEHKGVLESFSLMALKCCFPQAYLQESHGIGRYTSAPLACLGCTLNITSHKQFG